MTARKKSSSGSAGAKKAYRKVKGARDPHEHYHGGHKHTHPHTGAHHHEEPGRGRPASGRGKK